MPMPSPVTYKVVQPVHGGPAVGTYARPHELVPVPVDATHDEARVLRQVGVQRLVDIGAVQPVYEEG